MTVTRGAGAPFTSVVASAGAVDQRWQLRPVLVVRLAIALLLVAQLGRIPVLSTGTSEAPLLVNDLCVMMVLAVSFVSAVVSQSFRLDRVSGVALLFAMLGGISAVLAVPRFGLTGMDVVISLAYLARWIVYFGLYLAVLNVVRAADAMSVWHTLETTILVFAAFGIVQAIFLPHFAQLVYPDARVYADWDEQGNRLVSTVLEPNIAGAMIMIVLLVELAQMSGGERVALWKPFLLSGALVATLSRSSFLGLFVGGTLIVLVRGLSRRMLRFIGLAIVAAIASLPKLIAFASTYAKLGVNDASALTRLANWLVALRIFAESPIIGIGFNTYGFVQELYGFTRVGASSYSVDGGLLFVAVMTGVIGLSLYVGMLVMIVARCRRIWRDRAASPEWRALATGIAASTIAVCVHSVFVNSLLTTFVMEMLWILWGLTFVIARALPEPLPRMRATHLIARLGGTSVTGNS